MKNVKQTIQTSRWGVPYNTLHYTTLYRGVLSQGVFLEGGLSWRAAFTWRAEVSWIASRIHLESRIPGVVRFQGFLSHGTGTCPFVCVCVCVFFLYPPLKFPTVLYPLAWRQHHFVKGFGVLKHSPTWSPGYPPPQGYPTPAGSK